MHTYHEYMQTFINQHQEKPVPFSEIMNIRAFSAIGWYNHAKNDPLALPVLDRIQMQPTIKCTFKAVESTTTIVVLDWALNQVNYSVTNIPNRGTLELFLVPALYKVSFVSDSFASGFSKKEYIFGINLDFEIEANSNDFFSFSKTDNGLFFYEHTCAVGDLLGTLYPVSPSW